MALDFVGDRTSCRRREQLCGICEKHILEPLHMERSSGEYVRPAADANAAILYKMQKVS